MIMIITIFNFEEAQILDSDPKCIIYNYLLYDKILNLPVLVSL